MPSGEAILLPQKQCLQSLRWDYNVRNSIEYTVSEYTRPVGDRRPDMIEFRHPADGMHGRAHRWSQTVPPIGLYGDLGTYIGISTDILRFGETRVHFRYGFTSNLMDVKGRNLHSHSHSRYSPKLSRDSTEPPTLPTGKSMIFWFVGL